MHCKSKYFRSPMRAGRPPSRPDVCQDASVMDLPVHSLAQVSEALRTSFASAKRLTIQRTILSLSAQDSSATCWDARTTERPRASLQARPVGGNADGYRGVPLGGIPVGCARYGLALLTSDVCCHDLSVSKPC
jgi:hypothetical protein